MDSEEQQNLDHLTPDRVKYVMKAGEEIRQMFVDQERFEMAAMMRDLLMLARMRPGAVSAAPLGYKTEVRDFLSRWEGVPDKVLFTTALEVFIYRMMSKAVEVDRLRIISEVEKIMGVVRGKV